MSRRDTVTVAVILVYLLFFTVFGPSLAPHPIDHSVTIFDLDGERLYSPFAPNRVYPLGTDLWGYDLLTRILYGFRYTVLAVILLAGGRVAVGLVVGMLAGFHRRRSTGFKAPFVIPGFILVYFVTFRVSIGSPLSELVLMIVQGALIIAVGIPGTIGAFAGETRYLLGREFVEAAESIGAGPVRILGRHILPHMLDSILRRFTDEAVSVLTLLGQLAMFNVFFGGTRISLGPVLYHSRTNELAGIVGQYRVYLTNRQWLLLAPMGAYLSVLVGFFILSRIAARRAQLRRGAYI